MGEGSGLLVPSPLLLPSRFHLLTHALPYRPGEMQVAVIWLCSGLLCPFYPCVPSSCFPLLDPTSPTHPFLLPSTSLVPGSALQLPAPLHPRAPYAPDIFPFPDPFPFPLPPPPAINNACRSCPAAQNPLPFGPLLLPLPASAPFPPLPLRENARRSCLAALWSDPLPFGPLLIHPLDLYFFPFPTLQGERTSQLHDPDSFPLPFPSGRTHVEATLKLCGVTCFLLVPSCFPLLTPPPVPSLLFRENARRSCLAALERLRVKSIGLFTMRGPLPAGFNIEDTMQELKVRGVVLVRGVGEEGEEGRG